MSFDGRGLEGEPIHECVLAMKTRCFAGRLTEAIHAYPSASMAVQQASAQLFPLGRALIENDPESAAQAAESASA